MESFKQYTGSSVAMALAAGLASLFLEITRLGVLHTIETKQSDATIAIKKDDLRKIRVQQVMKTAFLKLGGH